MLEEKNFRMMLMIITIIIGFIIIGSYVSSYKKLPVLNTENVAKLNEEKTSEVKNPLPIDAFETLSSVKADVEDKLGEGKLGSQDDGNGGVDNYIQYSQEWFSEKAKTKYFYGIEDRIYGITVNLSKSKTQEVYESLKKYLGKPLKDQLLAKNTENEDEAKKTFWVKDAVRYTLSKNSEDQLQLTMKIEYYTNPQNHPLGNRPIEIQRINSVDLNKDGNKENILLIGDKDQYTTTYFKNIFVIVGTNETSYMGKFDASTDGGENPQLFLKDTDGDGKDEIIVETENDYTTNYSVFKFTGDTVKFISQSEKEIEKNDNEQKNDNKKTEVKKIKK